MFQRANQDKDMKMPFKCSVTLNCCWSSLKHRLSFEQYCPRLIWMCSFFYFIIKRHLSLLDAKHSFDGFHWFIIWLSFFIPNWFEYCLFSSKSPLYYPQLFNFSRMIKEWCHLYWGLCKLGWCSFLLENLSCSRINLHISKIISIQV